MEIELRCAESETKEWHMESPICVHRDEDFLVNTSYQIVLILFCVFCFALHQLSLLALITAGAESNSLIELTPSSSPHLPVVHSPLKTLHQPANWLRASPRSSAPLHLPNLLVQVPVGVHVSVATINLIFPKVMEMILMRSKEREGEDNKNLFVILNSSGVYFITGFGRRCFQIKECGPAKQAHCNLAYSGSS